MKLWDKPFLASMKLWQKIFLVSLAVVLAAVCITALSVLASYFSASVERKKMQDVSSHEYYASSLANTVAYERIRQGQILLPGETVEQLLKTGIAARTGTNTGTAVYRGESLIASTQMDHLSKQPEFVNRVRENGQCLSLIIDVDDRTLLNIGSGLRLEGVEYYLFTAYDVTEIYRIYQNQLRFISIVSIVFAIVTGVILWAGTRHLLRPLTVVNGSLGKITAGDYQIRIKEQGSSEFQELIRNVNEMTEAIQNNVEQLRQIADSRKRFVDSLAHEMKTPLTSVMCLGDVLLCKRVVTDSERQEYARIIVEDAKRLRGLSGKLLELSITDNVPLELERISIAELLEGVEASVTPVLEKRRLRLEVIPADAWITVDKELFQSLLYNLIDNGMKASGEGQTLRVFCEKSEQTLTVAVEDQGIGMSPEELKKITEPFYMADKSRSRKEGGVGLGLSLCASIAERHHAQLTFESALGKGTTVRISIPLAKEDP